MRRYFEAIHKCDCDKQGTAKICYERSKLRTIWTHWFSVNVRFCYWFCRINAKMSPVLSHFLATCQFRMSRNEILFALFRASDFHCCYVVRAGVSVNKLPFFVSLSYSSLSLSFLKKKSSYLLVERASSKVYRVTYIRGILIVVPFTFLRCSVGANAVRLALLNKHSRQIVSEWRCCCTVFTFECLIRSCPREWLCIHLPWSLATLPFYLSWAFSTFDFFFLARQAKIFKNAKHFSLQAIKFRSHCWSCFGAFWMQIVGLELKMGLYEHM